MLSLRYVARLALAFVVRFRLVILLSLAVGVGIFFVLNTFGVPILQRQHQKIGITGRFRPNDLPDFILGALSEGLTAQDESGTVVPSLASSWETPDKGKTWIFTLSQAKWQDETEVTSGTIHYEFTDVTIERPDEKTLVFKLQAPFSPFPAVVAKPVFKKGLLGVGEWKVKKITLSGTYVATLVILDSKGNSITYKFYPNEERAKLAFKLGEVDKLIGLFNPGVFEKWNVVNASQEVDYNKTSVIFLNTTDKFLSEKNIRQALFYAINKDNFVGPRAFSPIAPSSWAYNPQVKQYNYDAERAKILIDDLPDEAKKDLAIKLVAPPLLLDDAEKIAKDWNNIGVKTIVQVSSGIPTEYQALLAIYDISRDPDQYFLWHSTQEGTNISKLKNPRIDSLLESGRNELSLEKRKSIYLDFQRFLLEEAPAIFLYHPVTYTVERR